MGKDDGGGREGAKQEVEECRRGGMRSEGE